MDAGASDDDPDGHGEREAGDVDVDGNRSGADRGGRPGARHRGAPPVVALVGWAVAVGVLGWIDPVLVVLLGLVVGIVWLLRTDADPVHWGPVPRGRRRIRSSGSVAGRGGARPSERPPSSGARTAAPASVPSPGARRRP